MSDLIDQITGVTLPQAQHETSNLFQSELRVCLDWDDDFKQDLLYKSTLNHLPEPNEASKCIQSAHVSSVSLSDIVAAREGATCDDPIIKMIEVKQDSDGLKVSYTGDTLTLERAFQCGLIPASVYVKILQRQKTCQDTSEDVSLLEPVQEVEPCEVNRLILKCLSTNQSLTSGRDIHTLRSFRDGLSDEETVPTMLGAQVDAGDTKEGQNMTVEVSEDGMSSIGNLQNGVGLKVDAAVQCDLMSSSSTLTVLGNQQFMGLVLPPSGEIETVSTSFQRDQQITTDEFTSSLFSNREKIAAFYIPENSEVVDFTSAIQSGLIDTYTAEVLKSVEIPDVFPDVDHLHEKFSSWLMYKKLTVDGCNHAADCSQVDNTPTHTEAKQLFISYIMMNSYVDPKSGQRVLILDRRLSEMVQIFLEDPIFSENTDKNVTSLTLYVGDLSEQVDLEIPLHINEETEELMRYTQHTFDPHNLVSSVNGRITFDERTCASDKPLKQDPVKEFLADDDIDMDTTEPGVAPKTMCQNNINWTKSGEFAERICVNSLQIDVGGADSEGLDTPNIPVISVLPTSCSVNRTNVGSPSRMFDSECSVKSCHQTRPHYDADSLCGESEGPDFTQAEFLRSGGVMEGENEQDYAIHLLKAQMEEGGILDVTSGRRYDLEAALSKGLVDETTVLKLLDLQSDEKGSILGDEEDSVSVLRQDESDESTSSNIALCTMEQQNLLRSGCSISISDSLHTGLVNDESVDRILNSDRASNYPEENCTRSISDDHNVGLININETGITQQPTERKVAVMVLDLTNEEAYNTERESETGDAEVDCVTTGNVEKMSNYLPRSPPSVGGHEALMISPSSWSPVTAECVHHTDKSPLLAEDSDSQAVINRQLTDAADASSVVIENAAPTTQTRPSSLSERTPGISTDPESQTQYFTFTDHPCTSDRSTFDNESFTAGYDAEVGNQTVSESELDVSSSHRNVLSEERTTENDPSAVQSPLDSEPTPSRDYSSPRDTIESAIISVSRGNGNYDNNITGDGSKDALPQQAALHSESDSRVESEPRCSQNGQLVGERSRQSPVVSDEVTATNTINLKCFDVGDSEHYTLTTTRVPLESALADKDVSQHCATDDVELSTDGLSPERQHVDISTITTDTEQISASTNAQTSERSDKENADIGGKVFESEMNSGQSETMMGVGLGSDVLPEEKRLDMCASEHPQVVTDFLSDSCVTSDVSSSAPSLLPNAVKTIVDDQEGKITKETNVSDLQEAQTPGVESTIAIVPNPALPLDKGERDTPHGLTESSHPDLLMDLLKQSALSLHSKEEGNSEAMLQEEKVGEKTEQSDAPNIQLQLLQVLKTVSSSQDLSMLQEVMDTLNSALGGDSQEERRHVLESIKEEGSEGEDEGSAEDDLGHSSAGSHQPAPQSPANSDACKVEEVKNKVHFMLFHC